MPIYKFLKETFPPGTAYTVVDLCSECADFLDKLTGIDSMELPAAIVKYNESGNPYIHEDNIATPYMDVGIHKISLDKFLEPIGASILDQFAHEWMHHLLGEKLPNEIKGLHWLEESICALASIKSLSQFEKFLPNFDYIDLLDSLAFATKPINQSIQDAQAFAKLLPQLGNIEKTRLYQYAFALKLLPVFDTHPSLWRIATSLGHFASFDTLEDYFSALERSLKDEKDIKAVNVFKNVFPFLQR